MGEGVRELSWAKLSSFVGGAWRAAALEFAGVCGGGGRAGLHVQRRPLAGHDRNGLSASPGGSPGASEPTRLIHSALSSLAPHPASHTPQANARYEGGYGADHPTVRMFWQVIYL